MTTQAQYDAATSAVIKIVNGDINQEVPAFMQASIPAAAVKQFCEEVAKAAVDAAADAAGQ